MARDFFGIEKGLDIYAENGALLIRVLSGTAAPDGLGDQSSAPIGSLYSRSGVGELYQKISNAGNSADWSLSSGAAVTVGKWRGGVKVVSNDTIATGVRNLTTTPFSDDHGTLLTAADFSVGDLAIGGAGTTPVLKKVTAVSTPNVTFADADYPIANDDTFIADNYLPDANLLENKAIVNYNGSIMIKVADFDWSLATGINLSGSYAAGSGNPLAGDTIEVAIQKLDGNNDAQDAVLGLAQGATTLGTWTSPVDLLFAASSTVKAILQRAGDLLMQLRGVSVAAITTSTAVDSAPTASIKCIKWFLTISEDATPTNRVAMEVFAMNNGTLVDDNVVGKLKVGSAFNYSVNVDISAGNMRLLVASSSAGVTAIARRIEVVKSVL